MSSYTLNIFSVLNRLLLLSLCVFVIMASEANAQEFGRFFTTAKQRQHLDELRNAEPEIIVEIKEEEYDLDENDEVLPVKVDAITVKGLVYRNNGKSTAWVNNSNSYEGDLASEYTPIPQENIQQDQITLKLPLDESDVSLKVGQTYEPTTQKVTDIAKGPPASNPDQTE